MSAVSIDIKEIIKPLEKKLSSGKFDSLRPAGIPAIAQKAVEEYLSKHKQAITQKNEKNMLIFEVERFIASKLFDIKYDAFMSSDRDDINEFRNKLIFDFKNLLNEDNANARVINELINDAEKLSFLEKDFSSAIIKVDEMCEKISLLNSKPIRSINIKKISEAIEVFKSMLFRHNFLIEKMNERNQTSQQIDLFKIATNLLNKEVFHHITKDILFKIEQNMFASWTEIENELNKNLENYLTAHWSDVSDSSVVLISDSSLMAYIKNQFWKAAGVIKLYYMQKFQISRLTNLYHKIDRSLYDKMLHVTFKALTPDLSSIKRITDQFTSYVAMSAHNAEQPTLLAWLKELLEPPTKDLLSNYMDLYAKNKAEFKENCYEAPLCMHESQVNDVISEIKKIDHILGRIEDYFKKYNSLNLLDQLSDAPDIQELETIFKVSEKIMILLNIEKLSDTANRRIYFLNKHLMVKDMRGDSSASKFVENQMNRLNELQAIFDAQICFLNGLKYLNEAQ